MGLMGKGPAEWSQSLPNRKVNDASISTTFKLILNWYGPITTSSSITPTVWRTEFSNARTVIVFLFISQCPSPRAFTLLNVQTFKPLPLSITTAGTIWARQDTKKNRKRVRGGCPIGGDLIIGEGNHPRRHDLSDQVGQPFGSDIVFYMGLLQNLNHLLSVMFRGYQ